MKTIRTYAAVALIGMALTAFQSDALAQTRRGSSTSRSTSSSTTRSTSSSKSNSSATSSSRSSGVTKSTSRPKSTATPTKRTETTATRKPSTTVTRPTDASKRPTQVQPNRPASKPQTTTKPQASKPTTKPSTQPSVTPTRPANPSTRPSTKPTTRPDASKPTAVTRPARPADKRPGGHDHRPSNPVQVRPNHKPDPHRVHPRDRDFMHYKKPSYFWTGHNHYYGHRIKVLPSYAHRHVYHGVTYYCYNDIWYRPYAGYYVVCRPPFGTVLAANLIADMTWAAINFSYYYTVSQMYDQMNENNEYIAQQNALIAQNNAIIAEQNAMIAAGQQQAQAAYALANELGLIQSYAAAGSTYYYQDGVFYTVDANGQYSVIVPPAGALVETLPEDYDMVVLADGKEYYKVDDTVYRVTIVEGKPYFEVLGQILQ